MNRKFLFLLLLTCSSCSSIYKFSADVQEPARVTLPVSAQNVLILNNTVAQPKEYGIERAYNGQSIRTDYPLSLDSTAWSAMEEIAGVWNDSHFFKTIGIYKDPLRTNTDWLSVNELSPEDQSDFYDNDNYDALLVIDRLLFSIKENVKKVQSAFYSDEITDAFVDLRADGVITCSMYVYGTEKPLATFSITDSLFMKSIVEGDSTIFFKEIPEYMLHELSHELGNRAAKRFVPTWETVDRMFFTGYSARMQEATSYAANRKWKNAESLWTTELGKKTKPVDRAKIALNLAVANEMQDKLDSALNWAQKAKEQLDNVNMSDNSHNIIELTNKYISELERRIQNNRLLDLQWGKE